MGDDLSFELTRWIVEFNRDKALSRTVFEVFDDALVAGVIGDNQQEILMCLEDFATLFDGEQPSVIRQGMNEHRRILAGFDDFIEITYGAIAGCAGQGTID